MQTLLAHYTLTWQLTHTEHQFEAIYSICTIAIEGTPPILVMFFLSCCPEVTPGLCTSACM